MSCNVHVFYKIIFGNKFGFILEKVFSYTIIDLSINILQLKCFVNHFMN